MTFTITVQNYGTLDAILDSIDISNSGSYVIIYGIEGIQQGTRLLAGESKTFTITTEFDINAISIPDDPVKKLTITLNYIQDDGQVITPSDPVLVDNTLVSKILSDNVVQNASTIDLNKTSEEDGTQGLYYTTNGTENGKVTYFYRGAVTNNYVNFAGFYWRIVRINEDSSIRLIYQGSEADSFGNNTVIGFNVFNTVFNDNAYVGYMYGTVGSSSYSATHINTNDSNIKGVLDTWYQENLLSYASYLADSGFCGDRSISSTPGKWDSRDTALGYGTNITFYGASNRLFEGNKTPQFICPQENDLYTTASSSKGNKALDYPIGLLTMDEATYAGGGGSNFSYYLYTGPQFWSMTPLAFSYLGSQSEVGIFGSMFAGNAVNQSFGIRPVINLKSSVEITSGNGTSSDPYVIKTN